MCVFAVPLLSCFLLHFSSSVIFTSFPIALLLLPLSSSLPLLPHSLLPQILNVVCDHHTSYVNTGLCLHLWQYIHRSRRILYLGIERMAPGQAAHFYFLITQLSILFVKVCNDIIYTWLVCCYLVNFFFEFEVIDIVMGG